MMMESAPPAEAEALVPAAAPAPAPSMDRAERAAILAAAADPPRRSERTKRVRKPSAKAAAGSGAPPPPSAEKGKAYVPKKGRKPAGYPKGRTSSFSYYCKEMHPRVRKAHPKMPWIDLNRILAAEWKALTEEEKQKYKDMSLADLERFTRQVAEFEAVHGTVTRNQGRPKKKVSTVTTGQMLKRNTKAQRRAHEATGRPIVSRPRSAYTLFSLDHRPAVAEQLKAKGETASKSACRKVLSEMWRQQTPARKQTYREMEEEDVLRYHREIKALDAQYGPLPDVSDDDEPKTKTKAPSNKTEKAKKKTGRPKKTRKQSVDASFAQLQVLPAQDPATWDPQKRNWGAFLDPAFLPFPAAQVRQTMLLDGDDEATMAEDDPDAAVEVTARATELFVAWMARESFDRRLHPSSLSLGPRDVANATRGLTPLGWLRLAYPDLALETPDALYVPVDECVLPTVELGKRVRDDTDYGANKRARVEEP